MPLLPQNKSVVKIDTEVEVINSRLRHTGSRETRDGNLHKKTQFRLEGCLGLQICA